MSTVDRYQTILDGLMRRYLERVPDVAAITQVMVESGLIQSQTDIENDHIAFRTMGVPHLGIQSLEKVFLHYGYRKMDPYFFEKKRLDAFWYAPPIDTLPRIFISELRVSDLAPEVQTLIQSYTDEVQGDPIDQIDLNNPEEVDHFLHKALWRLPTWEDFNILQNASEYAAWVIYNRYYLNHYTISVHNLPAGSNTIAEFNTFLKGNGFKLNTAGGEMKTSADGLLIQSATVAEMLDATFANGITRPISGSYVEFAERKVKPAFQHLASSELNRTHRRDGFEAGNADKIFESTYSDQTRQRI